MQPGSGFCRSRQRVSSGPNLLLGFLNCLFQLFWILITVSSFWRVKEVVVYPYTVFVPARSALFCFFVILSTQPDVKKKKTAKMCIPPSHYQNLPTSRLVTTINWTSQRKKYAQVCVPAKLPISFPFQVCQWYFGCVHWDDSKMESISREHDIHTHNNHYFMAVSFYLKSSTGTLTFAAAIADTNSLRIFFCLLFGGTKNVLLD